MGASTPGSSAPPRARHHTRFDEEDDDPTSTLGTICNGFRTIAVGAYDAHSADRRLTHFTSSSPTRDGREVKPELVAPGMQVLAARSHPRAFEGEPPLLTRMSGTSMAAPHVTGTIALMFAAAGRPLAIDETRRLLLANTDPIPADAGRIDRLRLGGGYLNTAAAVAAARQVGQGARPTPALREVQEAADAALEADAVACGEESPEAAEAEGTEVVPEDDAVACGEESPEAAEAEGAEVALEADAVACSEESPETQETALAEVEGEQHERTAGFYSQ
ncbi:MAG TPA: S8 family serine peptidase [Dongiaceae bacterium]|nr:S8 family serine peptidase [Dongiaceae bacterium]